MLCTRHEMSCTFNPNLSWIHHHTEEKLFEFVLESRHATAAMNAGLRPLNLSDRPACNSALPPVVNSELKTRLTNWFEFDTCCRCMEEKEKLSFVVCLLVAALRSIFLRLPESEFEQNKEWSSASQGAPHPIAQKIDLH